MQLSAHHMNASAAMQEHRAFFDILLHDDRNSRYIVSFEKGESWRERAFSAAELSDYCFCPGSSCYVTHNGFAGRKRRLDGVRQLSALFFDIDCHDAPIDRLPALVGKVACSIRSAVDALVLPEPSLVVDSGRGVHLYYVLRRSVPYRLAAGQLNLKGERLFRAVQEQIGCILEEVVANVAGAKLDRSVFDHARVSRIPGTWNPKARRYAKLLHSSDDYHDLKTLALYKPTQSRAKLKKGGGRRGSHSRLMLSRLHKLEELQEYRAHRCLGCRERMAFVFYNTAVQVYNNHEAVKRLVVFNAKFTAPLPRCEIDGVVASVDKCINAFGEEGFYVLSANKVIELLDLTEDEIAAVGFFLTKREARRMEAKRKTNENRAARNSAIINLRKQGSTQAAIAAAVGCSLSTVKSVLLAAGLTQRRALSKEHASDATISFASAADPEASALRHRSKICHPCHVVNKPEKRLRVLRTQNSLTRCPIWALFLPVFLFSGPRVASHVSNFSRQSRPP